MFGMASVSILGAVDHSISLNGLRIPVRPLGMFLKSRNAAIVISPTW